MALSTSPPGLLEREAEVIGTYWNLLRSEMPVEWLDDERRACLAQLAALRDEFAAKASDAEAANDVEAFADANAHHMALAKVALDATPPAAASAREGA